MGDYTIRAQFDANCSRDDMRGWLTTPEGIAGWWSDSVQGTAGRPGDEFHVTFPTTPETFDLEVAAVSDDLVEWRVPESPPWWKGTWIRFELSEPDPGSTLLVFAHGGFRPDDPILPVITPAWVRFLDNLVSVAESGQPNPAVVNRS